MKRHGNEEEVIRIEKTDGDNPELILEEDHGQGDADDKGHIGLIFFNGIFCKNNFAKNQSF